MTYKSEDFQHSSRNVNILHRESFSFSDRIALWVTKKVGTMGFFLVVTVWTFLWLFWNIWGPDYLHFDPYPAFVIWLLISNILQILLLPLLLIGQNLQARHADLRAEVDFAVDLKSEKQIEKILSILKEQGDILNYLKDKIKD